MYVFLKEKMYYPAVCTEDRKHWILVDCTDEKVNQFCQEYNMVKGEEGIYKVHHSDNAEYFRIACASLPQRLSPMFDANQMPYESFFLMHKFFYVNKNQDLMVKGVYVGVEGEPNPFKKANTNPKTGFKCLGDVKLHG